MAIRCSRQDILGAEIIDNLRILMYGDCNMNEQVKLLGRLLAEYDNVPANEVDNNLLSPMYTVYDNGKPANRASYQSLRDPWWDNASFPTFQAAVAYARCWLGEWDTLPIDWNGSVYDYDGYGDTIEIRRT
jgi:hypothetical protein